ncbi:MAG: endolytic transglycosylase MltG [Nevskiaceae bacterium]|jgi:UPF0755 protein|nr:endolytic transglycosylase MltG [Nevskiaceae bacterium]
MTRRIVGLALLALIIAGVVGGIVYWRSLLSTAGTIGPSMTVQELTIEPGATLRQVLKLLQERQLIVDARRMEHFLRCCQRQPKLDPSQIKAGRYRIAPGQLPMVVLKQLVEGRVVLEKLTIIEGWRFSQMRQAIERHSGIAATLRWEDNETIMALLGAPGLHPEGRFAPDTYSFAPGTTDLTIYRLAFQAQKRILADAWENRQPDLPLASADEALILASIVERETNLASERARVAGVFINRLRMGMRLQTDPTVIYGIGEQFDGNIRRSDLTRDTPYNTYTRAGLPPTPISLPGQDALIATLNPEVSEALFFVAIGDGSGGHYFSSTLAEHNRAVQRYLNRLRGTPPSSLASDESSPDDATPDDGDALLDGELVPAGNAGPDDP